MLSVSAAMLPLAAVSLLAAGRGWRVRALGAAAHELRAGLGRAVGPLVQLVLAMAAASLLVLILPVQTKLAKPVALATGGLGIVFLLRASTRVAQLLIAFLALCTAMLGRRLHR